MILNWLTDCLFTLLSGLRVCALCDAAGPKEQFVKRQGYWVHRDCWGMFQQSLRDMADAVLKENEKHDA